jgi:hypothetical protein
MFGVNKLCSQCDGRTVYYGRLDFRLAITLTDFSQRRGGKVLVLRTELSTHALEGRRQAERIQPIFFWWWCHNSIFRTKYVPLYSTGCKVSP